MLLYHVWCNLQSIHVDILCSMTSYLQFCWSCPMSSKCCWSDSSVSVLSSGILGQVFCYYHHNVSTCGTGMLPSCSLCRWSWPTTSCVVNKMTSTSLTFWFCIWSRHVLSTRDCYYLSLWLVMCGLQLLHIANGHTPALSIVCIYKFHLLVPHAVMLIHKARFVEFRQPGSES